MAPVPPHASTPSDPIDFSRLGEVAEGDLAFEQQVLRTFLADMLQRFDLLEDALEGHDFGTILLESHNIKGAANNIGAKPLRAAAERCESAARTSRKGDCREALLNMREELERVRIVVDAHGA